MSAAGQGRFAEFAGTAKSDLVFIAFMFHATQLRLVFVSLPPYFHRALAFHLL